MGRIFHITQGAKGSRNKLNSMGYNTTGTSTYQKEQQITEYEPNISEIATVPRPMITRYRAEGSTGQYTYIRQKTRRAKPVLEHHRIILHHVQDMQNRLSNVAIQRESTQNHTPHITRRR